MAKTVDLKDMGKELQEILLSYNKEVTEATKKAVTEVADGVMREIKSHITWKDKVYSGSFKLKTIYDNERGKYVIWHVEAPHYRLTHLLELGHITRDGKTRSKTFPHVQYGGEFAIANLIKEMRERIEKLWT